MRNFKILLLLWAIFGTTNCLIEPVYYSEGSISNPVRLSYNTTHAGEVDGTYSSFYYYYGYPLTPYTISLTSQSGDSDLYVYVGDSSFTNVTCSSKTSGSANEYCDVYSGAFSYIYIEVYPYSAGTYNLRIY